MNRNTPPRIVANLRVDLEFRGRDTIAEVRQLNDSDRAFMGIQHTSIPINPELTEDIVGHGKARCRKDDHFEDVIGLELAAARALADYARQAEERADAQVKTEEQYQRSLIVREIEDIVDDFSQAMADIARRVQA